MYNFKSFGTSVEVPMLLAVQKFCSHTHTHRAPDYSNPPLLHGRDKEKEKLYIKKNK